MMNALLTLADNGCSDFTIEAILNDVIKGDSFEDDDDKRCCIALLFDMKQGNFNDPSEYAIIHDNVVDVPGAEYLVLTNDEANAVCKESIKDSFLAFSSSFLSGETGIDECVFKVLGDKCEDANKVVHSLINNTCGLDGFVEAAIDTHGRGHFLNIYNGKEHEIFVGSDTYYVYRVN